MIRAEDTQLSHAGNRFDVPGAGVLYAATKPAACFGETLARFRPSPKVLSAVGKTDGDFMVCGGVPADWRNSRVLASVAYGAGLPFVDVEAPETHEFFTRELAEYVEQLGYTKPIDVADVRSSNRRLTRLISAFVYSAVSPAGEPLYAGPRYTSRLDSSWECWAVFEDSSVTVENGKAIAHDDNDLGTVANRFGLKIF